ncbi:hypothetical protein BHE74_00021814 [Ensete ventricosum]|nr:hypothetical protein BHE74_00021814 [Ensete ventricosum]
MAVAAVPMAVPFGLIFLLSGLILNILQVRVANVNEQPYFVEVGDLGCQRLSTACSFFVSSFSSLQAVIFITLRPLSRNLYRRINKVLVELLMLQLIWLADWWAGLKVILEHDLCVSWLQIQLYGDSKTFELLGKD